MKVSNILVVSIVSVLCSSSFASNWNFCSQEKNKNKPECDKQYYRSAVGSCALEGACPQPYHPTDDPDDVTGKTQEPKKIVPPPAIDVPSIKFQNGVDFSQIVLPPEFQGALGQ